MNEADKQGAKEAVRAYKVAKASLDKLYGTKDTFEPGDKTLKAAYDAVEDAETNLGFYGIFINRE